MADPILPDGWAALTPAACAAPEDQVLARAWLRCFAGPDGARVLAHLKALTLDRALGPGASDAALRHLEGQRALVLRILALAGHPAGRATDPSTPCP